LLVHEYIRRSYLGKERAGRMAAAPVAMAA
jgi:hypothetical protein